MDAVKFDSGKVHMGTGVTGWWYQEWKSDGCYLIRERDNAAIPAYDWSNWPKQIADFEFAEGEQWTPEQIAAMAAQPRVRVPANYSVKVDQPVIEPTFVANRIWGFDRVQEAMDATKASVPVSPSAHVTAGELVPKPAFYVREDLIDWREPVPDSPGAVTTNAMLTAGFQAGIAAQPGSPLLTETLEAIYRAMHAVAPGELVSEGDHQVAIDNTLWALRRNQKLEAERDDEKFARLTAEKERDAAIATSRMNERRLDMVCKSEAQALQERDEAERQRESWIETARNYARGSDYYQGLLDQIGEMFGVTARTSDDGSVQDSVLRARLPELVAGLRSDLAKALAQVSVPPAPDYVGPTAPDQDGRPVPVSDVVHERFHQSVKDVLAGNVIQGARRQMQEALKAVPKEAPTTASTDRPMPKGALFGGGDPRRMGPEGI